MTSILLVICIIYTGTILIPKFDNIKVCCEKGLQIYWELNRQDMIQGDPQYESSRNLLSSFQYKGFAKRKTETRKYNPTIMR
jgi:hypothetical protein